MASILQLNPRHKSLVRSHRLDDFDRVMGWPHAPAELGHATREVARVAIAAANEFGGAVFVKREWHTPWKDCLRNFVAGFGWGTKARREWRVLEALARAGVGCPEPIVLAERGGLRPRGYLMLGAIPDSHELGRYLAARGAGMTLRERRSLARQLGREIARMHDAGIDHPDLFAKHILLDGASPPRVYFIDMQRSSLRRRVSVSRRLRDLAALDATVPRELASDRDRLALFKAYTEHARVPISRWHAIPSIERRSGLLARRRKIRAMQSAADLEAPRFAELDTALLP